MAGPQFDFDANNTYVGQYYEQSSSRGIAAPPGTVVIAEPGQRRILSTFADKATLDSWFKKEDYNEFLLIAKGNVSTMFMNAGHPLMSVLPLTTTRRSSVPAESSALKWRAPAATPRETSG